jgi:ankyrin repeat protein
MRTGILHRSNSTMRLNLTMMTEPKSHCARLLLSGVVLGLVLLGTAGCSKEVQLSQTQEFIFALDANNSGMIETQLRANPALCNVKGHDGRTPLLWAAIRGNKEVAELALADGADPNVKTDAGWTPLLEAVGYRDKEMAELLLAKGADINAKANDGKTSLDVAKAHGDQAIIELLRAHGGVE